MSNRLFVTGMFRSGTTLFARMLQSHDNIACASDPFRPFYNCLRDNIATDLDAQVEPYDPLGDYFADDQQRALFDAIQSASLNRPFPDDQRDTLLERIIDHAEPYSPRITERLDTIEGDTFRAVYDELFSYVSDAYGDGGEDWVATKEVWTTEFTPLLRAEYPDSRFILVVRDPRAVCASKNVQETTKYPWLFLIRQWRKIASLSSTYADRFPEHVSVVRYEDLVREPQDTVEGLCDFLDIEMDQDLLDPSTFVDGAGNQWLQNTSYSDSAASFDTSSVDKWRSVLSDREIEYIEQLCHPEMRAHGYTPTTPDTGLPDDQVLDPPRVQADKLADWIREYSGAIDRFEAMTETGTELIRRRFLTADQATFDGIQDDVLRGFFYDEAHARRVRRTTSK